MTQKEIIDIEQGNTGFINLYLEGTFYKAYERSAFAFCTRIKAYNVLRKEPKTLGRDILYVGFPQSTLDKVLNRQMFTRVDEKTVRVTLSTPIDGNEFLVWRDAQEVEQASRAMLTPYSRVIENALVYKTACDVLTQVTLISKTYNYWVDHYSGTGVSGWVFQSWEFVGVRLFLSASGGGCGSTLGAGSFGSYWSCSYVCQRNIHVLLSDVKSICFYAIIFIISTILGL